MGIGFIPASSNDGDELADVLIVGGGISGSLAAAALGRSGFKVCVIDRHPVYPPDFRAEHLDGSAVDQLSQLGFLDDLTSDLYRGETVTLARFGRVVGTAGTVNYGLRYETLVNRARASIPAGVRTVTAKVAGIETSDTLQRVRTSDGRVLYGRVVVVATGQGLALSNQLGIRRRMIREAHSLTFGFNIEPVGRPGFEHSFVVYQREAIRDRIDYLAAFTMGSATRINLFTYRDYKETWSKAMLANPDATLRRTLAGFAQVAGAYRATGPVVARPIDLYTSENYRRDGVVLVGDAFQVSCPATGMGMVRVLTDIAQLTRVHIPRWLATPGMGATKISAFYDDPVKRACDLKALHDAEYRRSVSTETNLRWDLHRLRVSAAERVAVWRKRSGVMNHPRVSAGEASLVAG